MEKDCKECMFEPTCSKDEIAGCTPPEDKQTAFDKRYLRMAHIWAENSYALRLQVGCLMVKNKMIISDGYNGMPSGFPNCCEYVIAPDGTTREFDTPRGCQHYVMNHNGSRLVSKPEVLHAEANAITKIAKSGNNAEGATIYVTDAPCLNCAKLIIQAGISRVVYDRSYRDTSGIDLLRQAGIKVEQIHVNRHAF